MRVNLPVSNNEYDYPGEELLMSTTDNKGVITHCNAAFMRVSGYTIDELMGQPHNLIRHPDVPPEAFKDLWSTIGHGRSWSGIVKNRRKNGDHYWVRANVTPIMVKGKPQGYMSVRAKPTREEVRAAEGLYAKIRQEREAGVQSFILHAGRVRYTGWRDWIGKLQRTSFTQRLAMERLNQIQINLRAVVGDARGEIGAFGSISREIAQGAQDLSARTESQASSLEETAASMEELSSTVRQSVETTQQVLKESEHSAELAQRGGQAVSEVAAVVQAIEQSSRKMGQIIATIEGIAFQTNILALNAAVEAARAGEQGRGFAVVASEVRALAQRSATAAGEIRGLIGESGAHIERGAQQMQSAGQTIEEVVQSVAHVNQLMGQIGVAAREQSIGISQVNEAVNDLDRVTQQNAALVEESAASARSMSDNAGVLGRTLDVFKMP